MTYVMDENTTKTFTKTDSESGTNLYYKFTLDSSTNYGTIISTNGLNKTFTFQSSATIAFGSNTSVTQRINITIYNDYPYLATERSTTFIDITINNRDSLPSPFIQIIDASNSTVYVNELGNIVTQFVKQNITLEADISNVTDNDIITEVNGSAAPDKKISRRGGTYQWWRSSNNSSNDDGGEISSATSSTYTLTQSDVSYYIYVTYKYSDGSTINTATSGKTSQIINVDDNPKTGSNLYITELYTLTNGNTKTSNQNYENMVSGKTLTVTNTIIDVDVSLDLFVKDVLSSANQSYKWYRGNVVIPNETNDNYTLVAEDVNKQISVEYTYTDIFGETTIINSSESTAMPSPRIYSFTNLNEWDSINYWDIEDGKAVSTNHDNSSIASMTLKNTYIATMSVTLSFDWTIDSESNYDYLKFYIKKTDEGWSTPDLLQAGSRSGTYSKILLGGNWTWKFEYYKDGSVHVGSDRATISNFKIDPDNNDTNYNLDPSYNFLKTPTIIRAPTTPTTVGSEYTSTISDGNIVDIDGTTPLTLSLSTSSPSWITLQNKELLGIPNTYDVGNNDVTIEFKSSGVVKYRYTVRIIVEPTATDISFNSITGYKVVTNSSSGIKTIDYAYDTATSADLTSGDFIYGIYQTKTNFTLKLEVESTTIIYNNTNDKYESPRLSISVDTPSNITSSISLESFKVDNNTINNDNISGDNSNGYYYQTTGRFTSTIKYKWIFNLTFYYPTSDDMSEITVNILDVIQNSSVGPPYKFKIQTAGLNYFLPDITTSAIQGVFFEKYMFIKSTYNQNNISIKVNKKPDWMKIQLITSLDNAFIPSGIVVFESIDETLPNVCNPAERFIIILEITDGSGLIVKFTNENIETQYKSSNYSESDFQWMRLNRADEKPIAARATAYPCYICGGTSEECADSSKFTKFQLDMRRKVETLKYKDKTFGYTKAAIISQNSRSKQGRKKQWGTQSILNTNSNVNNFNSSGFILTCSASEPTYATYNCGVFGVNCKKYSAAQSDVPGNKSFQMYIDNHVPVVGFVPVRKQYNSAAEKHPRTAYQPGDLGFPVGKSGRTPILPDSLTITFTLTLDSGSSFFSSFDTPIIESLFKLLFLGKRLGNNLFATVKLNGTQVDIEIILKNQTYVKMKNVIDTLFKDDNILVIFSKPFFVASASNFTTSSLQVNPR